MAHFILSAARELNLTVDSKEENLIQLRSQGGFLSYGNVIKVKLTANGASTRVSIVSKSAASIQLIDWSTNSDLEDDLKAAILDRI